MNIVHELNQLNYGGVERVIRNIIKFDKSNKHTVISYKDGPYREELEKVGAAIIIAPKGKEPEIEVDCDILHIHCGGAISEMAKKLGESFPVIETIHSPVRSPNSHGIIKRRVGVSDVVSRLNHECFTIHNGVDFDELQITRPAEDIKAELGIPAGKPVVGRLGRIGPDKCMEEWILACWELQKNGLDFIPLIIGPEADLNEGYRGKLKLMAASLPVKGIIWADTKKDIANYLQIMDVFLYPSPGEGFGLVFMEAIFCGSILVTYKTDLTMEIAGGYSILTGPKISDLAAGVKTALTPGMRDEIMPLAQSWVEAQFDAQRMSQDYQDIYNAIMAGALMTRESI